MTEQKLEKLLPCPFHKLNTSVDLTDNDYGRWFVVCGGCGASSGHCKTKERAVYSWNNDRAPTKKEADLQADVEMLMYALEGIKKLAWENKMEYLQKAGNLHSVLSNIWLRTEKALNQDVQAMTRDEEIKKISKKVHQQAQESGIDKSLDDCIEIAKDYLKRKENEEYLILPKDLRNETN